MSITIDISQETLRRLQISASIKRQQLKEVVEQIVERSVPMLDETAAPLRESIAISGMSEHDVDDFFADVIKEVREETPLRSR